MERKEDIRIKINVPTIALAIPPPSSPIGFGRLKRNSMFKEDKPFFIKWNKIKNNGTVEINERKITTVLNNLSFKSLL
jgi:hypothetical protein